MKYVVIVLVAFFFICCSKSTFNPEWTKETAPPNYTARFETSKGNFDIEVTRAWSPQAADRLHQLLTHSFYDNQYFYRVVPNFVVQFGNIDTIVYKKWEKFKVPDEPVLKSNLKGYVSFARDGKETRGNDLFINLKDNVRLDTVSPKDVRGYPVLGYVTNGMDVVEKLYSGYGNKTMDVYDSLSANRKKYLQLFPKMDSIKKAYIIKNK
ncbi:peptidylprolyl isomerase [Flavobacterium sangjuense]|uniref:peptidylprolyl isomerase n=1 Tax=Flavobacterium sangjuense TaxID=2518177 RepID=A0A4P7PUF8_9FLAO|nr:peptidylprolyl isomerase [Flavobacterium sangjuense]QBZ98598.1 Peptidyl-prolyl cis-trans isomerase A [Flavobacterium sangjuense]